MKELMYYFGGHTILPPNPVNCVYKGHLGRGLPSGFPDSTKSSVPKDLNVSIISKGLQNYLLY